MFKKFNVSSEIKIVVLLDRYMKIRNYILDMWEQTKPHYLFKTSVRSGLKSCGDVNSIGKYFYLFGCNI